MPTETARQNAIATHILKDPFARKLGARFEAIRPGYSRVMPWKLTISWSTVSVTRL